MTKRSIGAIVVSGTRPNLTDPFSPPLNRSGFPGQKSLTPNRQLVDHEGSYILRRVDHNSRRQLLYQCPASEPKRRPPARACCASQPRSDVQTRFGTPSRSSLRRHLATPSSRVSSESESEASTRRRSRTRIRSCMGVPHSISTKHYGRAWIIFRAHPYLISEKHYVPACGRLSGRTRTLSRRSTMDVRGQFLGRFRIFSRRSAMGGCTDTLWGAPAFYFNKAL